MQSPRFLQYAIHSHPCQLDQVQGVHPQPSVVLPLITHCCMSSCMTIPSSFDTFRASTNFPSEEISLLHTHAAYSKQPIPELANNHLGSWTLTLNIPIPEDIIQPTLTSLSHTIKYGTANHNGASAVQSNILLALPGSEAIPAGISTELGTFEDAATMCLSSIQGIKQNSAQGPWSYFTDRREIPLNARITQNSCLYLQLRVSEHPTVEMLRSLSVDISATWLEDQEGRRLVNKLRDAEARAADAEAKAAAEEAGRKAAEAKNAADQQAKEIAEANQRAAETQSAVDAKARREAEEEARNASTARQAAEALAEAQKVARESADANAEQARLARESADHDYAVEHEERVAAERNAAEEKHAREVAEHKLQEAKKAAQIVAERKAEAEKLARETAERLRLEAEQAAQLEAKRKAEAEKRAREEAECLRQEAERAVQLAAQKKAEEEEKRVEEETERLRLEAERAARLEAQRKAEADKRAKEEAERLRLEAEKAGQLVMQRKAEADEHAKEEAERLRLEAEKAAQLEAQRKAEAEKLKAKVADEKQQEKIKDALHKLPADRRCRNGYEWIEEAGGYRCKGGKHHITWAELNAEPAVKTADAKTQGKIDNALCHLPVERRCSKGLPWIQEPDGGYRCAGRGHHITLEELNAAEHHASGKGIFNISTVKSVLHIN